MPKQINSGKPALTPGSLSNVFVNAGHMGEKILAHNWAASRLGVMTDWPQSLQSALSICVNSNFPIAIYWGPELVLIYNDAWAPILGNKHPMALGKPAIEVWPEIWPDIEPQFQMAFAGTPGGSKDALLPMQRHGYTEECYFDFTFTPIYGESGKVEGIFNAVIETTYRVINERRAGILQKLSDALNSIQHTDEVFVRTNTILNQAQQDIPFFFLLEFQDGKTVVHAQSDNTGKISTHWPVDKVLSGSFEYISLSNDSSFQIPQGYWPEKPSEAILAPLRGNDGNVFGCFVAGISARRKFDKDYRSFFESIATIVAGELNTIQSLDEQRNRAEALAQIDKAKTAFFSNISHEFRTPLTLMLGPLQEVLDEGELMPKYREHLSISLRNTLRLQKLVNTLLDFSRIEAGKMDLNFEEVDLGRLTEDLASSFRSAIESAGMEYVVSIQHGSRVYVDPDMWEKIVLNLISNAFKYTHKGRVEVQFRQTEAQLVLKVTDTGIGISPEDQSKIFERFYRVSNSEGRSQEGTGIGLSMVKELVLLHQGIINVESEAGKGSTFSVSIPVLQRNASSKVSTPRSVLPYKRDSAFVNEALGWNAALADANKGQRLSKGSTKPSILLADDNSDMRSYIERLLMNDYEVRTATSGEEAFELALSWVPDLIISDIMMPKLDGFGLLKKLKATLVTRNIPIIFLSALAGEEAKVEGITAGADDYLVKPFSARELVARVANHILINKTRRQIEKGFYNLFLQCPAHIHVMKGPDHVMEFFHPLGKKFLGGRDITGMKIREALPEVEGQGYFEMLDQVYQQGKSFFLPESKASLPGEGGKPEDYYFNITYLPLKDPQGKIEGVMQFTFDVTEQAKSLQKIKESEERFRLLVTSIPQIIWIADTNSNIEFLSEQWETYTGIDIETGKAKFSSFIHPDDVEGVREKWFESIRLKKPWKCEYRLRDVKTNGYRWFFGHTLPLLDESGNILKWIGSASDIHDQKVANEKLESIVSERTSELLTVNDMLKSKNNELLSAQNFLQTVLDSSVELVTAFDKNLTFTFVNNKVTQFSNRVPEELIGKNLLDVVPDFEKTEAYQQLSDALKGKTIHIPAAKSRIDNSLVFETFMLPLKRNGEITGVVAMQRDITAMVNLSESLKMSNAQLMRSNEDLQQFAHVTSHDLKEPVRKIKMYGNLLKTEFSEQLPERGNELINKIQKSASRITDMIDGILQYSSAEAFDQAFEPLDLNVIVANIVEDLEVPIAESGASVNVERLPAINGSATLIHQLFYNLINNSIKFRRADQKLVIAVRSEIVSGSAVNGLHESDDYLRIELQDNGIGFDQEYAERIFEAFSRLNPKDKYEGTGLGLALCKKIVLRHKGYITASGSPNAGATFAIFFPKSMIVNYP